MKASIIILDFLKSKRVVQNVESIQQQVVDFPIEIIVVDNSRNAANEKKLRELEKFQPVGSSVPHRVKLIFNTENLGYTRGTNRGAQEATGEYLFIVNPDIIWSDPKTLQKMVRYLDAHPKVGILGPKQVNDADGEVAMTVRAFPKLLLQIARRTWLRHLPSIRKKVEFDEMQHLDYDKTQAVDWLQSSFIAVRRDLWEKFGGLDERYFLFMSDPDICWKCWEVGYEVVYYPEVTVHADGLRCSAGGFLSVFGKWTVRQHLRDALKYHQKYRGRKNPRLRK